MNYILKRILPSFSLGILLFISLAVPLAAQSVDALSITQLDTVAAGSGVRCDDDKCDLVALYLNPIINILSGIVGLVITGSIIMGGIQFSSSEGDPQKAAKAKARISAAILALFAYLFLYMFLQFLIPGGVFNR